ncbi:MAG: O-antigen ligase family protein [Elusimicrobiota bacterium]|jgi:O-antigen ligase
MPADPLEVALFLYGLALPLSMAGANIGWGLVLAALLWKARGGWRPARADLRGAIETPLWLFVLAAGLCALFGTSLLGSLHPLRQDAHKLWLYYLLAAAFAAARPAPLLTGLSLGFCAAASFGIGQSLGGLLIGDGAARSHAFVHPVTFGEQAAVGLIAGLSALVAPAPETAGGRPRRMLWVWTAALGLALFLSNTRGAALGAAAGIVALFPHLRRYRRWSVGALIIAAAVLVVMEGVAYYKSRSLVAQLLGLQTGSTAQMVRVDLWKAAVRMGLDHPWTGVGPGHYRTVFGSYFHGILDGGVRTWGTAHNLYLHHLAERGVVGLGALFLLVGSLWYRALERVRRRPDALNLWAYGTVTAFVVMNLTEVALQVELIWMLVWTVWLLAEAEHRRSEAAGS